jgi:hypothetical protein
MLGVLVVLVVEGLLILELTKRVLRLLGFLLRRHQQSSLEVVGEVSTVDLLLRIFQAVTYEEVWLNHF